MFIALAPVDKMLMKLITGQVVHLFAFGIGLALPHRLCRAPGSLGQVWRGRSLRHRPLRRGLCQVHVSQHPAIRNQRNDSEN